MHTAIGIAAQELKTNEQARRASNANRKPKHANNNPTLNLCMSMTPASVSDMSSPIGSFTSRRSVRQPVYIIVIPSVRGKQKMVLAKVIIKFPDNK